MPQPYELEAFLAGYASGVLTILLFALALMLARPPDDTDKKGPTPA